LFGVVGNNAASVKRTQIFAFVEGQLLSSRLLADCEAVAQPPAEAAPQMGRRSLQKREPKQVISRLIDEAKIDPNPEVLEIPGVNPKPLIPDIELSSDLLTKRLIDHMNKRNAVIGNVGGKTRVLDWIPSLINPKNLIPSFQSKEDFKNRYSDNVSTAQGLIKQ